MTVFDFCDRMVRLCRDVTRQIPVLRHIDIDRVLVTASLNRKRSLHGVHAAVTPLRFPGGGRVGKVRGQTMVMPLLRNGSGTEQFYILTFYLPRYLETTFAEKIETVTHELWHIGPQFDGTLREFPGPCRIHGPSRAAFDAQAAKLARDYLQSDHDRQATAFLRDSWSDLRRRYSRLRLQQIARPQMRPIASSGP